MSITMAITIAITINLLPNQKAPLLPSLARNTSTKTPNESHTLNLAWGYTKKKEKKNEKKNQSKNTKTKADMGKTKHVIPGRGREDNGGESSVFISLTQYQVHRLIRLRLSTSTSTSTSTRT